MANHRTLLSDAGGEFRALEDILPPGDRLRLLIVGKTPSPKAVERGHYLRGQQGQSFWRLMHEYGLLNVYDGEYEDDALPRHGYGITDVVKRPHPPGEEPTAEEYAEGRARLEALLDEARPEVLLFVYKGALDGMRPDIGVKKTTYGLNHAASTVMANQVFVAPLPGVGGCTSEQIEREMRFLARTVRPLPTE